MNEDDVLSAPIVRVNVPDAELVTVPAPERDPIVSVKGINSSFDQIEVEAAPAEDILGGGYVLKSSVNNSDWAWRDLVTAGSSAKTFAGQMIAGQNSVFVGNAGDAGALEWFRAWEKKIGNVALRSSKAWSLASTRSPSTGTCLQQSGGIGGIISTNAAVYEPGAPTMNAAGTTLSYRVAGPLKDAEGKDLVGIYSMDGDRTIQTASLVNKDGWANFSATGFSYDDAAFLEVSISKQALVTPSPTPTSTPSNSSNASQSTTTPSKSSSKKVTSIKCVKGKKTITVKTKLCPNGYSKKN
ncbi:MAG: hypothetical protein EBY01_04870 [Actinobacteria bacterium]|nr:hypothetical protein [Actinomycetota bacterium]